LVINNAGAGADRRPVVALGRVSNGVADGAALGRRRMLTWDPVTGKTGGWVRWRQSQSQRRGYIDAGSDVENESQLLGQVRSYRERTATRGQVDRLSIQ